MTPPDESLSSLRKEYARAFLDVRDVDPDPFVQFRRWFTEAQNAGLPEPNAMTLATATKEGRPSARAVLLKSIDETGFAFFTNFESRKAREIAENPAAALLFFWAELERQVRIEGIIECVSDAESDQYFRSRPRESQIGAWASKQSETLPDRSTLEHAVARLTQQYAGCDIPRPPHWGGYRLLPSLFEFWQGRPSRLHDRIQYLQHSSSWHINRLSP